MIKFIAYLLPILALSACSSVNATQNGRLDSLEEKVDALLVYNNKTYDVLVDNELRIAELEKDAKKRGVPVPQKMAGVENLTVLQKGQAAESVSSQAGKQESLQNQENLPEQQAGEIAKVGVITGQDLTQAGEQKDLTPQTVTANITQAPQKSLDKQTADRKKTAGQTVQNKENASKQSELKQPAPKLLSSKDMYNKAYALYQHRQYAQAEKAFDEFLAKYPQDVLAPNALYWKGETLYARALYAQAVFAFKEVQTRYPKHPKTADSLLKTAMSYARLGDNENASLHYLVLVEDWPSSEAARKARAMGVQ